MLTTLDLLTHQMHQKDMLLRADKERLVRIALSSGSQSAALRRILIHQHGLFTQIQATVNWGLRGLQTLTSLHRRQNKRRSSQIWGTGQPTFWAIERQREFVCNRRMLTQVRSSSNWLTMGQGD